MIDGSDLWSRRGFLAAAGGIFGASLVKLQDEASGTESTKPNEEYDVSVSPFPSGRNQRCVNPGKSS